VNTEEQHPISDKSGKARKLPSLVITVAFVVTFFFSVPVMLALFRSLFLFRNKSALLDGPMAIEAPKHPSTQRALCPRAAAARTPTKSGKSMCASIRFWTVSYGKICRHLEPLHH
jgi:hypothetical protein